MELKKAVLVISFGTSYEQTRKRTIEAIEDDVRRAFPERTFFRAWTSGMIRKKIRERDGLIIPSVSDALENMAKENIEDLLVVTTLITPGGEFNKIIDAIAPYRSSFKILKISRPLLDTEEDMEALSEMLFDIFNGALSDKSIMVFMGHGSETARVNVYERLNEIFDTRGHKNYCTGTVEFEPGISPVYRKIEELHPEKVYLTPLLIVAGDHAMNDMSGDREDSWKHLIENKGPEVCCIVKGLGGYEGIRSLFVKKAKEAV